MIFLTYFLDSHTIFLLRVDPSTPPPHQKTPILFRDLEANMHKNKAFALPDIIADLWDFFVQNI